ncbi:MAG: XRE family transcriptional regulator [Verrucomicrobiota bacterium]|jgi:Zn-dependent peptidase ImmA (M78 family)/DNA-binding XRE family transcriptional regulator|nr:XRE family transcriptional regulator [Verrucomicrobiota bacterium]OQC64862.1 MAG: helix-turn-helix protein [Verrucomicrobia bacterium ADurb.Bin006]HOI36416.1 XRE family transcriptional regulator [Bacillota bacterium]HOF47664.1 XRE family transcriptional regulator [Verrucomicrobiota bacterium]HOU87245.1 XRE family transcriptional regulator [Verrucomicrobiota bacterium]
MNDTSQERFQRLVGRRIQIAREELGLSQEELSKQLGFPVRQTLSNIEAGKRKVTAEELMKFMAMLKKNLDYFTDSFLMIGEASVSWRAKEAPRTLNEFEKKMLPVVAVYRELMADFGGTRNALVPQLPLTSKSSFEEAIAAADRLAEEWKLDRIPAKTLISTAEERLGLLVLMVDAPAEISGAAVHLPEFDAILINRNETAGRRNYDFGHELFHVLTWHSMPPEHLDQEGGKKKRVEQLADAFTSTLLMPAQSIHPAWESRNNADVEGWLKEVAELLGVSSKALFWRLVNLGYLSKADLVDINLDALAAEGQATRPKLYSRRYVECLHKGLDKGSLSVRRAAGLLDCTIEDLEDLFRDYGMEPPFDL